MACMYILMQVYSGAMSHFSVIAESDCLFLVSAAVSALMMLLSIAARQTCFYMVSDFAWP